MKLYGWVYVLIALVTVGCSSDGDTLPTGKAEALEITAKISNPELTSFEKKDEIGIYSVNYKGSASGILGDISNRMNVKYTFDGKRWFAESEKEIMLEDEKVDLYAYYPYDEEMSGADNKLNLSAYPFDLSGRQQGRITDFLWAKTGPISNVDNTVGMVFSHLLTRYEINLHYDRTQVNPNLVIHNLKTLGLINLRTGTAIAESGNDGTITPVPLSGNAEQTVFSYEAIVPPQQILAETPLFSVSYNDETVIYVLPLDMEFKSQKSYVFNLIVGEINARRSLTVIERDF